MSDSRASGSRRTPPVEKRPNMQQFPLNGFPSKHAHNRAMFLAGTAARWLLTFLALLLLLGGGAPGTLSAIYFDVADDECAAPQECDFEFYASRDAGEGRFSRTEEHESVSTIPCSLSTLLDLDTLVQDFVLETHQIYLVDFPDAFNPALVRWKGRLLLSFRVRDRLTKLTNQIGFVWLSEDFQLASRPFILQTHDEASRQQDPRLVVLGEQLYMVYSNLILEAGQETRRMFVAEVSFDGQHFVAHRPSGLFHFLGERSQRWEKNWVPFVHEDQLLLGYSIVPHYILRPLPDSDQCAFVAYTLSHLHWPWGPLRGGTPAIREGDEYLAIFHSSKEMATLQSQGKKMSHYFMGAYTFSARPPFHITRISPEPIVGRTFYSPAPYRTWKPLRVVFPCGLVGDTDHLWVSYGKQDHEIWIAKLDKKRLLESLRPVALVK